MTEQMTLILGWSVATLVAYALALWVYRVSRAQPLLHPLVVTSVIVGGALSFTHTPVADYQQAAVWLHWLLGPATVALAVPLYKQLEQVRQYRRAIWVPIVCGGIVAPLLATVPLIVFAVDTPVWRSMLTKSITTPLAMETTLFVGGVPALAAVFVIVTGIVGAIIAGPVFRLLRVSSQAVRGLALGTVAHAVGTARAVQEGEVTAAFSTLALCINGILTALVLPIVFYFTP